jgi:uncharacterized protein (DUF1800 family)
VPTEPLSRRSLLLARPAPRRAAWAAAAALPPPDPIARLVARTTFGARPQDVARARDLGFAGWVEEQLHPERLEDAAVDAHLAATYPTLGASAAQLLALRESDRRTAPLELKAATLHRAVSSARQLFEVLVDFWSNHFNVYHGDGPTAALKTVEDREVLRRHALGRFRDLLHASAKSPAMLVYLDNFSNVKQGPNENYARELMELHTIGVDGGYGHMDVEEVARAFTGWTVGRPAGDGGPRARRGRPGEYLFAPQAHDDGARAVLGHELPAGLGRGHGERVLDLLAAHPATARHVATKLVRRLVADAPPAAAVDAASSTFAATGGDLREVVRAILLGPDFAAAANQKFKRPFEFVVSAVRALGAAVDARGAGSLLWALRRLGQLPFDWPAPDGYPDTADAWGSTSGVLDRWQLGLALAANAVPGVRWDPAELLAAVVAPTPAGMADGFAARLLQRPLLARDRELLIAHAADGRKPDSRLTPAQMRATTPGLVALLLDSPYFQWR